MAAKVMGSSGGIILALVVIMLVSHCNALSDAEKNFINAGSDSGVKIIKSIASFGDQSKSTRFRRGGTLYRLSGDEKESINVGLDFGVKVMDQVSTVFEKLSGMVGFLGAAGGFVSFLLTFLPAQDSAELTFMKSQFALVNTKLDTITSELDDIKNLITFENQRSIYISSSHHVLFGHRQLSAFIKEIQSTSCDSKSACKRVRARIATRYLKSLNVKPHLDKILRGTYSRTSVYGNALLTLVSKSSKCSIPKIDQFTNGILKLAFKGQQVELAFQKLMGSKQSIAQSMKDWLSEIYRLRSMSFRVKNECFNNIWHYMQEDVKNSDYQIKYHSNKAANRAVKEFLERKYPWVDFVVFSYNAHGNNGDNHCNGGYNLQNIPQSTNDRKRNLIVQFLDRKGTYNYQINEIYKAFHSFVRANLKKLFYPYPVYNCGLWREFQKELAERDLWKFVKTLHLREKSFAFNLQGSHRLKMESKRKGVIPINDNFGNHMLIILRSMEEVNGSPCKLDCKNHGRCIIYPKTRAQYCQCQPFYQGDLCKEHSKAELAKAIDSMIDITLKLPVLSDVSFDIKDLRQFIGTGFANMMKAISNLESSMQQKLNQLSRTIKDEMKWKNLILVYKTALQTIEYYAHRFQKLPAEHKNKEELENSGKKLALSALNGNVGIRKALYQLNNLISGEVDKLLLSHKPILLAFMESRSKAGEPCTKSYKTKVDNYWKVLLLLQHIGYSVWAQAREFAGMNSSFISNIYKVHVEKQLSVIKNRTCQYSIENSINVHCNGHYLHPGMTIQNRCKRGYYVHGSVQTSCKRKRSSCRACSCFPEGSKSQQCTNSTCLCKPGFYGHKCNNRNCVWRNWSSYGPCQSCGYGAKKLRNRIKTAALGTGAECYGSSVSSTSCFKGCCGNKFHCSNKRKCIPGSLKCNYDNDCGDKQDEKGCNEQCYTSNTTFSFHGGGKLVQLDRHQPYCGNREAMKMFHMQRSGDRVRYQYICCKMTRNLCDKGIKKNKFTYASPDSRAQHLGHQKVSCGPTGYISSFKLQRSSNHRKIRYEYNCCNLSHSKHEKRTLCYKSHTRWTEGNDGKSYYLAKQTVRCRNRYFINSFHLEIKRRISKRINFRYHYRCCKVVA